MTTRRGARPTHVRPRPPSNGRPAPTKVRPRAPQPGRVATHRPIVRGAGLPLVAKVALMASPSWRSGPACCTWRSAACGPSPAVSGRRSRASSTTSRRRRRPTPSILTSATRRCWPRPTSRTRTRAKVDLEVTVPGALVGSTDSRIRVYLALQDQPPTLIAEHPDLRHDPQERHPDGSSRRASTTSWCRSSDRAGSPTRRRSSATSSTPRNRRSRSRRPRTTRRSTASRWTITGKVQARSTLIARNADNDTSITATAESDGTFKLTMALKTGTQPHHASPRPIRPGTWPRRPSPSGAARAS